MFSNQSRAAGNGAVVEGDINRAFVSYPALYKHLAFDGSYLHGVPEELRRECSTRNESMDQKEENRQCPAEDSVAFGHDGRDSVSANAAFVGRTSDIDAKVSACAVAAWIFRVQSR